MLPRKLRFSFTRRSPADGFTTLSAAETTQIAGYTDHDGKKVAAIDPELVPKGLSSLPLSTSVFSNACRLHLSGAKSLS
jgi:hypothetical protein